MNIKSGDFCELKVKVTEFKTESIFCLYCKKLSDSELLILETKDFHYDYKFKVINTKDVINVSTSNQKPFERFKKDTNYDNSLEYIDKILFMYEHGFNNFKKNTDYLFFNSFNLKEMEQVINEPRLSFLSVLKSKNFDFELLDLIIDNPLLINILLCNQINDYDMAKNLMIFINTQVKGPEFNSQERNYISTLCKIIESGGDYQLYPRKRFRPTELRELFNNQTPTGMYVEYVEFLIKNHFPIEDVVDLAKNFRCLKFTFNESQFNELKDLTLKITKKELKEVFNQLYDIADDYFNRSYLGQINQEEILEKYYEYYPHRRPKKEIPVKSEINANSVFL